MKKIFITIIAMLLPLLASAIKTDKLYYIYDSSTKTATLTRNQDWACYTGDIIVPSKVTYNNVEYTVTAIGEYALEGSTDWDASPSSVTIPNTVKSISKNAFYDSQLNSIYISDISAWCNISFGDSPSSYKLYVNGTLIKNLEIPSSVKSIGERTFSGCKSLTTLTIPNSVTSIGDYAFSGCSGLTSINIPNSVTSIGSSAFYGCSGLTSINIPKSVTSISSSAFSSCSGLRYIFVDEHNSIYNSPAPCYAIIRTADNELVLGCKNTNIPGNVTSIGDGAFSGCSGLTSIYIPNNVTSIGSNAFYGCSGLTSVTIPNSVTSIGNYAFSGCSGLTSINIPNSVTSIGSYAFGSCNGLTFIASERTDPVEIGNDVFPNYTTVKLIVPSGTMSAYQSKAGWDKFTNIVEYKKKQTIHVETAGTLPNLLTEYEKSLLEELTITGNLNGTDIACIRRMAGANLNYNYNTLPLKEKESGAYGKLKVLDISGASIVSGGDYYYSVWDAGPDDWSVMYEDYTSNNTISAEMFKYCKLTKVVLPNNITSIGYSAFQNCSGLTSIYIPSSVTSIAGSAFQNCSGLTSISVNSGNTMYDSRDNCNAIIEKSSNTLVVGCKNTIIPNSVTSIGSSAFSGCSGLTSIDIPNGVSSIGYSAFSGCNNLKYICLTSDVFPSLSNSGISTNCQLIIPQKAYESGIPSDVKNFSTYSDTPMLIQVRTKTATSAVFELRPVNDPDNAVYTVTTYGQTPGQNLRWKLDDQNYGIVSEKADETLTLEVQAAEAMSINKARLLSTVTADEPDDDQHYGFEWLRYDAPENMTPNRVLAPLYKGEIVGTLNKLNPEIYYKYRPFYKSDDGTVFRGEWEAFLTGDANVFFEPDVHTKEPVVLSDGGIVLLLFFAEGTEEILEKGFELIKKALESFGTRSDGGDVTKVIVSGNEMSATVEGLEPGTEYIYRSYVKTASGTTYGEDVTFKTPLPGDANNDGVINAADIVEVVNAKAGNPSASFIMTNADMDGSGSLTEADINAIVNIIMQK